MSRFYPLDDDDDEVASFQGGSSSQAGLSSWYSGAAGPSSIAGNERTSHPRFSAPLRDASSPFEESGSARDANYQRRAGKLPALDRHELYAGMALGDIDAELLGQESETEIAKLTRAWVNERGAPEILRWRGDTIDEVMNQIEQQQNILDSLSSDDATSDEEHFRLGLVQLDLERAKWLLKGYLRVRLHKIEQYATYIVSTPSEQEKLSDLELGYSRRYHEMTSKHYVSSVLSFLPENMRGLEDQAVGGSGAGNMVVQPDLDSPVFIRCITECGPLRLPDGGSANLAQGTIHLLRYRAVSVLVDQKRVELL